MANRQTFLRLYAGAIEGPSILVRMDDLPITNESDVINYALGRPVNVDGQTYQRIVPRNQSAAVAALKSQVQSRFLVLQVRDGPQKLVGPLNLGDVLRDAYSKRSSEETPDIKTKGEWEALSADKRQGYRHFRIADLVVAALEMD